MVWPRVWQAGPVVLWQPPRSVLPSPAGLAGLTQKDGLFFFFSFQALLKMPSFSRHQTSVVYNSLCPLSRTTGPNGQFIIFLKRCLV